MAFTIYHCFVMLMAIGFGIWGMNKGFRPDPDMPAARSPWMLILAGGFMMMTGMLGLLSTFLRPN